MNPRAVEKITQDIHRRFPEFSGISPTIHQQPIPKSRISKKTIPAEQNYLLVFETQVKGQNDQVITRRVRVVSAPTGKIIKITTSR